MNKMESINIVAAILAAGYVMNTITRQEGPDEVVNVFFGYRQTLLGMLD